MLDLKIKGNKFDCHFVFCNGSNSIDDLYLVNVFGILE